MYQLEVKYNLIKNMFNPNHGWDVIVDIDSMERGKGSQNKPEKIERVKISEEKLIQLGVKINNKTPYGRVDILALHPVHGIHLIEVEGKSSKQKEQALYSALGQIILLINEKTKDLNYGIAVPDNTNWETQLRKLPNYIKEKLNIKCYLVSDEEVRFSNS